ncbi:MAG: hypothetical protein ABSG65_19750 [Bryobacteraceae bacterium]|jgi:hypothetical protein
MPLSLSCVDLAAAVTAQPCPLLFLDTAAILDVRVPFRHELQVDIVDSAATIVDDAVAEPRRVWLVTSANVMQEFEGRLSYVMDELTARLRDLSLSIARVSSVAKIAFPERRFDTLNLPELKLEKRMHGIMDRLVNSMVIFRGTPLCVGKARDRLWAGLPPASKARQEFKDCEIFEEFLKLLAAIRSQGFGLPAIFITPNKEDYGPPPDGYAQIASEMSAFGASYAANLSWALSLIRPRTK